MFFSFLDDFFDVFEDGWFFFGEIVDSVVCDDREAGIFDSDDCIEAFMIRIRLEERHLTDKFSRGIHDPNDDTSFRSVGDDLESTLEEDVEGIRLVSRVEEYRILRYEPLLTKERESFFL